MATKIQWTDADMIEATVEHWGDPDISCDDCRLVETTDGKGDPCLIVIHPPTGHTSDEAGDAGRWHLDRTAY